jgi:hypothetical protein
MRKGTFGKKQMGKVQVTLTTLQDDIILLQYFTLLKARKNFVFEAYGVKICRSKPAAASMTRPLVLNGTL